ncbi:N-acetylmuramoyl-L-alanine amidase [Peribacillus cavernae]|uniref:N-acetylmuramoyl-L-alanine amidase n=1 Tax=Peribacillus cavernae TaxID=1674310 RepID=A0A433HV26_9BACI|nr:N-acetylmuramoyl-L-alanine amidase [Peribacillus cavernae]MDQ0220012.1 N-acetylmuramoyl-L-alanine amidase [Peribacillus cavernae]RUQ32074.1 N-acetylmuramoyl-L-alanine amidase [Peribacillus cavernae]
MKIILDAGHGYQTSGKRTPDGMQEYEFNRAVASHAKLLLDKHEGVTVHFTHSDHEDTPLRQRTDRANVLKADVFVSIHANAFGNGSWNDACGIETFVYTSKPIESLTLAEKIQSNMTAMTGLSDRGVKAANFHVLRETICPSILVECGFMTNLHESALLHSDEYRKICAKAIVKSIVEQFQLNSEKASFNNQKKVQDGTTMYRVQAGAFKNRKNAEELVKQLKQAGFESTIIQD